MSDIKLTWLDELVVTVFLNEQTVAAVIFEQKESDVITAKLYVSGVKDHEFAMAALKLAEDALQSKLMKDHIGKMIAARIKEIDEDDSSAGEQPPSPTDVHDIPF
jgi:hypothetical protein